MKPDEEMHAAVEEADLDPCDLYTELGTLIVEGRVPGLNDRGFGEGPHCSIHHAQNRHQCDPQLPQCQKYEQILKHMLLLWKNGIPMTIEVLLYPGCCAPLPNLDSVPDMPYILLEQWTIHMLPRRVPDANISSRGLIQAVRSFLYFSQLCAWYSLTGGKSPENVHYRVCVPGEAFSSKFSSQPDCHLFPVANIGRNSAMKVLMKCHPRCGEIPSVPCHQHSEKSLPLKECKGRNAEERKESSVGEYVIDGILPAGLASRTSSPADSMLGESLLDPPNSLCMYPKRYQSPSRCGSPSMEVPEHLMFGKSSIQREQKASSRKSRPQRRPVVERFLKKNMEELCVKDPAKTRMYENIKTGRPLDKHSSNPSDIRETVLNYCCIDDCMKHVPREEMEQVLERLRDRHQGSKCLHGTSQSSLAGSMLEGQKMKSLSQYVEDMKISSEHCKEQQPNKFLKISDSDSSYRQFFSKKPLPKTKMICDNAKSISELPSPTLDPSTSRPIQSQLLPNKFKLLQSTAYCKNGSSLLSSVKEKSAIGSVPQILMGEIPKKSYQNLGYWDTVHNSDIHPNRSTVNIKKLGAFLPKEDNDERQLPEKETKVQNTTPDDIFGDEAILTSFEIPSAEKKALFRRSLDSATSLVFHQRSGLPLTSSPAPTRKCGTCFDFDSSLTTVSAIKRALFEKECEGEEVEEEENAHLLSNSAPASIFSSSLLGTFEESVLNGRLEPVSTVEGFTAEIGASGSFCPRHIRLPVTVFFYTLHDMDKVTSPYMGHINLKGKEYHVPKKGTVQVTLFNPHATVVKMFVVRYNLCDMPVNCQTFLRQRTLYMPSDAQQTDTDAQKWLRYLIHLRFNSSKSGRIYLHTDIRAIIFRKSDLDAATVHGQRPYELRTFTHGPQNPKFSPHKQ